VIYLNYFELKFCNLPWRFSVGWLCRKFFLKPCFQLHFITELTTFLLSDDSMVVFIYNHNTMWV